MVSGVIFEGSAFGIRAVLNGPWSGAVQEELLSRKPEELELNSSKGWVGARVDFLQSLPWLKSLIIIDFKIEDVGPVHFLAELTQLKIFTYCKTRFDFTAFPFLKECSLEWRRGAESVFDCGSLTNLFLNRYKGKSSQPFGNLKNLQSLGILNAPIAEVEGLRPLHRLKSLRLARLRPLNALTGLEDLFALEEIDINTCRSFTYLDPLYIPRSIIWPGESEGHKYKQ